MRLIADTVFLVEHLNVHLNPDTVRTAEPHLQNLFHLVHDQSLSVLFSCLLLGVAITVMTLVQIENILFEHRRHIVHPVDP
jgi:hypothetical protein